MKKSTSKTAQHYSRRDRKANGPPAGESFGWFTFTLMGSAAFRALSKPARTVLDRIYIEHGSQGGRENGRLKVTWRDFERAGVQPRRIVGAIAEVEALGLAIRTQRGRRACGEDRGAPAQFRLTWLPVFEPDNVTPATNEWKCFGEALTEAKRVAKIASGRTMDQRKRASIISAPRQDIEGAVQRGVQEKAVRGVQKKMPASIRRGGGVQSLHSVGGAEEKDFEANFVPCRAQVLPFPSSPWTLRRPPSSIAKIVRTRTAIPREIKI
ncbi:MAG: hypothetical protein WDN46_24830 [Methylocella sp.]